MPEKLRSIRIRFWAQDQVDLLLKNWTAFELVFSNYDPGDVRQVAVRPKKYLLGATSRVLDVTVSRLQ